MNLGQYDRAIADYTETIRLRPGSSADVYAARGYVFHRKGDDAHAVEDYSEKLKSRGPMTSARCSTAAMRCATCTEMNGAGADYSEAIRLAPATPAAGRGAASSGSSTQDFEGAVADFSEAIRLSPNEGAVYLNRGAALALIKPECPRARR